MNIAAAGNLVNARDFSTDKRKKMAKQGTALPDGSFPISNEEDVHNAVSLLHNAKNPKAAKAHIRRRAKALGMGDPFGEVKAGGPGSGPRPGQGRESALLNKYGDFMVRTNPDITDAMARYEHAAKFFDNLGNKSKATMHKFFNHMGMTAGGPGSGRHKGDGAQPERWAKPTYRPLDHNKTEPMRWAKPKYNGVQFPDLPAKLHPRGNRVK